MELAIKLRVAEVPTAPLPGTLTLSAHGWAEPLEVLFGLAVDLRDSDLPGDPGVRRAERFSLLLVLDEEASVVSHRLAVPMVVVCRAFPLLQHPCHLAEAAVSVEFGEGHL